MSETTNPEIANLATQKSALPLRQLQLIGVAGTEQARRALLRLPNGKITTVQVGDHLRQGTVQAIAPDAIVLLSPQGTRTLNM